MKAGDKLGIRGPYGTWFDPQPGVAIVVGGGIGLAAVRPLIHEIIAIQKNSLKSSKTSTSKTNSITKIICITGAKTEKELLYSEELEGLLTEQSGLSVCTDDGSCGFKGFTTDRLDQVLKEHLEGKDTAESSRNSAITIYACGPEKMLSRIYAICKNKNVNLQLSLERMMRCGFGLCGLCAMEPTGLLVCRDGPIFTGNQLEKVTDFGHAVREFSGKVRPI